LASFNSNPAGAAIVNAVGPIRQVVSQPKEGLKRYLVIVAGSADKLGDIIQRQVL